MSVAPAVSPPPPKLEELLLERVRRKRIADAAAAEVKAVDVQIVDQLRNPSVTEGTVSKTAGFLKVSVGFGMNRNADTDLLQAVPDGAEKSSWELLSTAAQAAFRWKAEVSVTNLRALNDADKLAVAPFIETKPASPSIKLEAA